MLVANEMRSLTSDSLKKKMKRQILQVILEINRRDSESHSADSLIIVKNCKKIT